MLSRSFKLGHALCKTCGPIGQMVQVAGVWCSCSQKWSAAIVSNVPQSISVVHRAFTAPDCRPMFLSECRTKLSYILTSTSQTWLTDWENDLAKRVSVPGLEDNWGSSYVPFANCTKKGPPWRKEPLQTFCTAMVPWPLHPTRTWLHSKCKISFHD